MLLPLSGGLGGDVPPGAGIWGEGADGLFVSELPGVPLVPAPGVPKSVVLLAPGGVVVPGVDALGFAGVVVAPGVVVVSGVVVLPGDPIPPLGVPGLLDPALVPSFIPASATSRHPETGVCVSAADARACTSICAV